MKWLIIFLPIFLYSESFSFIGINTMESVVLGKSNPDYTTKIILNSHGISAEIDKHLLDGEIRPYLGGLYEKQYGLNPVVGVNFYINDNIDLDIGSIYYIDEKRFKILLTLKYYLDY